MPEPARGKSVARVRHLRHGAEAKASAVGSTRVVQVGVSDVVAGNVGACGRNSAAGSLSRRGGGAAVDVLAGGPYGASSRRRGAATSGHLPYTWTISGTLRRKLA
jgi:hypothetical protein